MPSTADAYTHRIGRTSRAARTGEVFTFVTSQDISLAHSLKKILGDKLSYDSVDALTVVTPSDKAAAHSRNHSAKSLKMPDSSARGKSFSYKKHGYGKSKPKSLPHAGHRSWTH